VYLGQRFSDETVLSPIVSGRLSSEFRVNKLFRIQIHSIERLPRRKAETSVEKEKVTYAHGDGTEPLAHLLSYSESSSGRSLFLSGTPHGRLLCVA
jgi:hypothetical protein